MSFNFANKIREELKAIAWDIVVIDEAISSAMPTAQQ